ncbi:hypothetical protein D3C86_1964630 [compost metagenome]
MPWVASRPRACTSLMNTIRPARRCPESVRPNCLAVVMALTVSEAALARPMTLAPELCACRM